MADKDRIIEDAIEALRENANGLKIQGFEKWAETTSKIANHLERQTLSGPSPDP